MLNRNVGKMWGRTKYSASDQHFVAEPVGFEPTVGSTPTQLFESCTFGRSDTVPEKSLVHSLRRASRS
jgi:hypothetical protein